MQPNIVSYKNDIYTDIYILSGREYVKKIITFLMVITLSISLVFAAIAEERNALSSAKRYLTYMPFSYQGLVEQLEFEGFTSSQAEYGASKAYK